MAVVGHLPPTTLQQPPNNALVGQNPGLNFLQTAYHDTTEGGRWWACGEVVGRWHVHRRLLLLVPNMAARPTHVLVTVKIFSL